MAAQAVSVARIPAPVAAAALAGLERLDPAGRMDANDVRALCERAQCFALAGDGLAAVYVLTVKNGVVWVDAAHGTGPVDCTAALDAVITEQSQGAHAVALQTARRGLVRKLQRQGYTVAGWIMRKAIQ